MRTDTNCHHEDKRENNIARLTAKSVILALCTPKSPTWQRNENSYAPSEIGRNVAIVLVRDLAPKTATCHDENLRTAMMIWRFDPRAC